MKKSNSQRCPKENMREDAEVHDRKRAYHLGMSYDDFVKRKAELIRQVEKLKGAETA